MRPMLSFFSRCLLAISVGFLGACGDVGSATASSSASVRAPLAKAAVVKRKNGIRFTIDGPVFGGPTQFVVPGDHENVYTYMSASMFNVTFRPKEGLLSQDGKHRLNMVMFGTEPGGQGEFTDASSVRTFSMSFAANVGTAQSQSVSMTFKYSKGTRQPVRLAVERYETSSDNAEAAGDFTARLQRTNIKSNNQFYEVQGDFNVR